MSTSVSINVDTSNPGQFFACCGLLEIAHRVSGWAEGWFEEGSFAISSKHPLPELIKIIQETALESLDPADEMAPPIRLEDPINLTVNWWTESTPATKGLKLWAGSMRGLRIARAMKAAITLPTEHPHDLLNVAKVVTEPSNPKKKVEPFYFDARRAPNAHARDVGFSANDLSLETVAHPAVEFLCLIGLQRARPVRLRNRIYAYSTWSNPTAPPLLPVMIAGIANSAPRFVFESWFRTGQKKHKAFLTAQVQPAQSTS